MSFNPIPSLGGASWSGNPPVATTKQLLSTSAGIINIIDNLPTGSTMNVSTLIVSSFTTLYAQLLNASTINSLNLSTGSLTAKNASLSGTLNMSNNNITNVNTIGATTGNFTSLTGNLNGNVSGDLTGNVIGNISNANLTVNGKYSINETADVGTAVVDYANYGTVNITGKGGLGGIVHLTADVAAANNPAATVSQVTVEAKGNYGFYTPVPTPGYTPRGGLISIVARQGLTPIAPITSQLLGNGEIDLTAYSYNLVPGLIKLSAGANSMYAGPVSPITGLLGNNYIYATVANTICAGSPPGVVPTFPGTNFIFGSVGTSINNNLYTDNIYNYGNITTGVYSNLVISATNSKDVLLNNVRTLYMQNTPIIDGAGTGTIDNFLNVNSSNLNINQTGFISSLTVNDIIFSRQMEDFSILNVSSLFASTATIRKIILPNTPTYSIEQQFFSTSLGNFNTISSATNNILSTSIQLTTASLPEISFVNNQVFNNANIGYWASTIVVAQTTDQPILSNTLAGISPNTGRLVYRNLSGVPLVIYAPYNGGTTGLVIPQNSNWGFTYNGSYWDVNQNPADVGGTYGTSFSLFQNYNTTTLKTPDILSLDAPLVNITGSLGNTSITTANITTATINQLNSSNITLQNTPNYSIEQSFISTTGTPFVNISNATNYILSTSISLTATTLATNPIVPNLNIGNSNVDYWASTIQVATDFGAAPSIFNTLLPLTGGLTGQITYSNASLTKTITINQFPNLIDIPSGSNYQFTWNGSTWLLNTNPTNTSGTSGTSFSLFQNYNNTTLKTPDILTLDAQIVNITGLVNGINIGTATIDEATANQITTNNITMSNTPTFSIEQSFFSTTTEAFGKISSVKNLIISTSTGFTTGTQEQQPFIDNFRADATNIGTWASTVFIGPTTVDNYLNSLTDLRLGSITGGQIDYSARASPILIGASGAGGSTQYTVPANATYRYTWDGNNWNQNTNPPSRSATFGTSFALFQDYYNTTLKSPDTITIDSASLNVTGVAKINQLNLTNLDLSTINTSNLTAVNGTIANLNTTNLAATNFGIRSMTYSTITGNPVQGTIPINQNTNYTGIGRTLNLASNLQYSVFPNISSLTTQTVFNNTINYNRYPGGYFQLMPTGSVGGQVLYADGTITSPNPLTGVSWFSSIMGVFGGQAGTSNYSIITIPPNTQGEFLLVGTRDPYSQYQINIGGTGYQLAITSNDYHKWSNLTGSAWTSNITSAVIYPTINTTDTASLVMQPGGLLNLNTQYLGFGNGLRVVSYTQRVTAPVQNAGAYGKAQIDNVQVIFQGKKFNTSDYNCTISMCDYGADQANLATNQVAVNTYTDAQGNWLYQLRMTTATIPAYNITAHWQVQVLLTPRIFASGTNTVASFTDPEIWAPLEIPGMHVSSMTASTISMYSSENVLINAAVPFPAVIGVGNIGLNASTNIDLMANYDINIDAYNSMFLTATSSITLSNVAGTAGIGFDENATTALYGSNVYLVASSNAVLSSSNVITIESLSTINTTSYNYYQAASNLTELHNENYSNTSRTSANHITPNFVVSTCLNSYYIQNVRQPMIQYDEFATSGTTGSNLVVLPVPYSSINAYKAFATMEDEEPAQISVKRLSPSTFDVYWGQAGGGSHTIAWHTLGNVDCGGAPPPPPPSEPAAYSLVNTIYGDTGYFTWTQDGAPGFEQVYLLQSADDTDYATYTTTTVYTPELTVYSLPQNYYYKFYVSSDYSGTRVDSSNSSAEYVFGM